MDGWMNERMDLDFFYSKKNNLVQLEDTTIKTEHGCPMQHTERTTVAHYSLDLFYHTWGEWVELTDKKEWGETDKTMAEEFQNEM